MSPACDDSQAGVERAPGEMMAQVQWPPSLLWGGEVTEWGNEGPVGCRLGDQTTLSCTSHYALPHSAYHKIALIPIPATE